MTEDVDRADAAGQSAEATAQSLAAAVLEEEAKRQADQEGRDGRLVLPDDLLPGVGDEPMKLKEAVQVGGISMLLVLFLLNVIDDLPRAIRVIAPDIQDTLNISDTTLAGVLSFGGVFLVLGSLPMASLADRIARVTIIPIASVFWAITLFLTGLVQNPGTLFVTNSLTGLGQAYRLPLSTSLLTDTYPIQARAQVFAAESLGRPIGQLGGPLLVGGIASIAGGDEGWRWAFFFLAIPPIIMAVVSLILKEPPRGQFDQDAVLGEILDAKSDEIPPNLGAAFARLSKVRTFYFFAVGIGTLGFALIAVPLQFNLLLEDKYNYGAFDRAVVESLMWVLTILVVPIAGRVFDNRFRRNPEDVMRIAGMLVIAAGPITLLALLFKAIGPLVFFLGVAQALLSSSFVAAPQIMAAVSPFRIRTQAFALLPVFIFLMGGFLGGVLTGSLSDTYGNRTAMMIVAPPAAVIGGLLVMYGSRFIKEDISVVVSELLEEQEEEERMKAEPDKIPVIQVRNLDYSYGPVQVLFDCALDVNRGEVLALLGNNGAGKSTLLRAISGLGTPDRGVVRVNGRTMTYVQAEQRFHQGVVQLRGGAGIFRELTIGDNLRASLTGLDLDRAEIEARIERVIEIFPALDGRLGELGGDLSGGQQQMLALAMALMHEPEVLLIDELSLGLAPVVVQELLSIVESLRERGQTMVIVEQSVNVALSIADRAAFMEKGRVRFEGSAQELLERDDLLRAVFLGGEGG